MLALRRGWGLPEDFKAEIPLTLPEEFKAEMVKRKVACAGAETWCYGGSVQQRSSEPSLCNVKQFYNYMLIKGVLTQL